MAKPKQEEPTPIPMLLWCPKCSARHIDEGEFATRSHTTHACQECGMVWKPALIPTTGVQFLPGYKNDPPKPPKQLRKGLLPVRAVDVAAYILSHRDREELTITKLHHLVYYCQAWGLVWDDASLFVEPIEAWENGPVIKALYDKHKDHAGILVSKTMFPEGDPGKLSPVQKETVEAVLDFYGDSSGQWLTDLSVQEGPWKEAQTSVRGEGSKKHPVVISHESMVRYYSTIP